MTDHCRAIDLILTRGEPGVRETIRWYRGNRAWWEPLLAHRGIAEESWSRRERNCAFEIKA